MEKKAYLRNPDKSSSWGFLLFILMLMTCHSTQMSAQKEVFNETFDTPESMDRFSTIDVNNDDEFWKYYNIDLNARCTTGMNPHDDWMITPGIEVKPGCTYKISFYTRSGYGGGIEVGYATEASDAALSTNILVLEKALSGSYELIETVFTSQTAGTYYIGFHAVGGGFWSWVDIDNITITETEPQEPETVLYGTIVTDNDNAFTPGIYSFVPGEQMELTPVAIRTDYIANGGGVYLDGNYYFTLFMTGTPVRTTYNIYNFDTGNTTSTMHEGISRIASDMAYDPTTGKVYCCSMGGTATEYVLSTMDLQTGEKTVIAPMEMMAAIAVDADGQVYGISDGGILYAIDKEDASLTEIGDTGFRGLGEMIQSATIDPETGEFWWAMANKEESGLYKVDVTTGKTELAGRFPNGEHIAGLFMRKPFFDGKAPYTVSGLELSFDKGSKSGQIACTAPSTDISGSPLGGPVDLRLIVDGKVYAAKEGVQPGTAVEMPVTVDGDGWHEFAVIPSNTEGGNGQPANRRMYVGYDTPKPVTGLTLVNNGGTMTVAWTAPDGGVNGGYVDPEAVTYDIQRYPDYSWVATGHKGTTFTDEPGYAYMRTYSYGVVAKYEGRESEMLVTNFVTVGDELALPIYETFEIPQTFENWSIIDANNDGDTWKYSTDVRAALYEWSISMPTADDWLVSPKFRLEPGKSYDLAIDAVNSIAGEPEKVEVFIGTEPTAEGMTRSIIPLAVIDDNEQWTTLENTFSETDGGMYHIGIHVTSDTHIGDLLVRNISLKESTSSGITGVEGDAGQLRIKSGEGLLAVDNGSKAEARIFTADGILCGTVSPGSAMQFNLSAGMYIVTNGPISKKVMVTR